MPLRRPAIESIHAAAPPENGISRCCGYIISCQGENITVTLAGKEIMHQPYPGARRRLGEALGTWVLEPAGAFVDARRVGTV